jgi:hypothetical protein
MRPSFETSWGARHGVSASGRIALMGQRQPRLPGIAVAVAYDANGRIEVIVDWKSGVDIDAERLNTYHRELGAYRRPNGTSHGLLAPMTMRQVIAA